LKIVDGLIVNLKGE
jgi:hypothetical protein